MSLKSALVSIFCFVSAVLACYHPEQQRPRLLHRVEEAIDGTLNGSARFPPTWAGVMWPGAGNRVTYTYASSVFAIPDVQGRVGWGLSIGVGLGNHACNSMAWAEVNVTITDSVGGISAHPHFKLWNYPNTTLSVDQPFNISRGDNVNLTVQAISPTTVFFVIENISTRKSWSGELVTPDYPLCGESVEWFTTTPAVDDIPYAIVNFTNNVVGFLASEDLPKYPGITFQYQQNVSATIEPQGFYVVSYSGQSGGGGGGC